MWFFKDTLNLFHYNKNIPLKPKKLKLIEKIYEKIKIN
jgi:hypothetical protein